MFLFAKLRGEGEQEEKKKGKGHAMRGSIYNTTTN